MGLEGLPDAAVPEQFQLAIDRERGARLCRPFGVTVLASVRNSYP
jgi:hypothetical protein